MLSRGIRSDVARGRGDLGPAGELMARAKIPSGVILLVIVGLVVLAVLVAPAESDNGGGRSTYSAGPSGVRIAFDLARRLGWSTEIRELPFKRDIGGPPSDSRSAAVASLSSPMTTSSSMTSSDFAPRRLTCHTSECSST